MNKKVSDKIIMIIFILVVVISFLFLKKTINSYNDGKTTDMAYCLTLNDYLIKVKNKEIKTIDKKTSLYMLEALLNSKKEVFIKTCPSIYKNALKTFNEKKQLLH